MKNILVSAALLGALCGLLPTVSAATTFTYTAGSATDVVPSFSFTTSLTGAALANLAPGTNITATVSPFTFQPDVPAADQLGFSIGGPFGSNYFHVNSGPTVQIGTNALGQITSWNITEGIFASYPAVDGEDPNDFFVIYSAITTNVSASLVLTLDNDAGLGTPGRVSGTGSFGAIAAVPSPIAGAGIPGLVAAFGGFLLWRKRQQKPSAA